MNININSNQFKIYFSSLIISLLILIPLTLVKETVTPTVSSDDMWHRQSSMSTVRSNLYTAIGERFYSFNRQTRYRYSSAAAQEEPPVTLQWTKTYGGSKDDQAFAVLQTADGGFALAGNTYSFGAGSSDFWLVKTDINGFTEWNQTYGGSKQDWAYAVIATADGGFVLAGRTNSYGAGGWDAWLVKTDASGMIQWNRTFGGPIDDWVEAIIQTTDGGFALIGLTNSYERFDFDIWFVKIDAEGYTQWTLTYSNPVYEWGKAIIQTTDGGFVLVGYTRSTYIRGNSSETWLIKTDLRGVPQWNRTYGGSGENEANAIIQTFDGGLAFAGYTSSSGAGSDDFWLIKTDPRGVVQWNRTFGGPETDWAFSIIQTMDGGLALAGWTYSFGAGSSDGWLVKTDPHGVPQWNYTYGGPAYDWGRAIIQMGDRSFMLAGSTGRDAWLVKLVPIPETTLTTPELTTSKETPPEPPVTTIVTTTEIPLTFEFTPEFEGISILLAIPFLLWLRRKSRRG